MKQGRTESFTARSNLDPKTVHKSEPKDVWPIPTLKFADGCYWWYLSTDTPWDDAEMAWFVGFKRTHHGRWYTQSATIARRLAAFGDMRTRERLLGPLNRYDPFLPNPLPNDLLPRL